MMKKRLISGLLTVVLVAGLLAGCGGSASSGQEGSDRQDTSSDYNFSCMQLPKRP